MTNPIKALEGLSARLLFNAGLFECNHHGPLPEVVKDIRGCSRELAALIPDLKAEIEAYKAGLPDRTKQAVIDIQHDQIADLKAEIEGLKADVAAIELEYLEHLDNEGLLDTDGLERLVELRRQGGGEG